MGQTQAGLGHSRGNVQRGSVIDCLPRELLAYLFQFIPARYRVLVVSRVCKRWLAIVREGLCEHGVQVSFKSSAAFALFPNLTAVKTAMMPNEEFIIGLRSLSRLVSLDIFCLCCRISSEFHPAIYNLTSLRLLLVPMEEPYVRLLSDNASSLRSLEVETAMLYRLRRMACLVHSPLSLTPPFIRLPLASISRRTLLGTCNFWPLHVRQRCSA